MSIYEEFLKKGHKIRRVKDFRDLVYESGDRYGQYNAFVLRDRNITYSQFKSDYISLCTAFFELDYENKRIAIIGANSYEWILSYLAAATVGVAVPIDKELDPKDMLDFAALAECTAVFADDSILSAMDSSDITKYALSCGKDGTSVAERVNSLAEKGSVLYANGKKDIDTFPINAEEMSVLIFTSGTTGSSKGVCLSQKNICANINQTARMVKIDTTLHSLSVLPLHHTYETTLGHLLLLSGGACISYADGLLQVAKNINEYSPSVLIVVPQLLEFMLKRIDVTIRRSLPKFLLPDEDVPLSDMIKGFPALIRFVVKRKVKKNLGGRLRLLIVGAAPIKPEVIEAFCQLGIATYQGYGLTETSPLIAGNNDFYMNPAAVGLPIHGVEIKIENPNDEGVGEIIARGDNVMLGYYNDPEATAHVMRGGYFHTGDLGRFDEEGFLYITGRCKNVIVAQNGKNIYPEELESRLMEEPCVAEAIVIGVPNTTGGTAIKAKIFPSMEKIQEIYGKKDINDLEIQKEIASAVANVNEKLPVYKKITVTEIVPQAFEKTTTRKIKRFGSNIE